MLNKLLREIVGIVVGKNVESIADLLNSPKYVNEFNIAKKLDITINQTRNILYRVSEFGLVSSIRKKDKKKGWYTYFWTLNPGKGLSKYREMLSKEIGDMRNKANVKRNSKFFLCKENKCFWDSICVVCTCVFPENVSFCRGRNNVNFLWCSKERYWNFFLCILLSICTDSTIRWSFS